MSAEYVDPSQGEAARTYYQRLTRRERHLFRGAGIGALATYGLFVAVAFGSERFSPPVEEGLTSLLVLTLAGTVISLSDSDIWRKASRDYVRQGTEYYRHAPEPQPEWLQNGANQLSREN